MHSMLVFNGLRRTSKTPPLIKGVRPREYARCYNTRIYTALSHQGQFAIHMQIASN